MNISASPLLAARRPLKAISRGPAVVLGALVAGLLTSPAAAAPKPLISYFLPMPIMGQLSSTVWGAGAVGKRDSGNGLEDGGASGGVAAGKETYFYWDGKIVKGEDGKFHMYASRWLYSIGFGPPAGGSTGWGKSIPMQAISDNVMGPYVTQGNAYAANQAGNNMGHNTTALVAPSGASPYTLSVGEVVPGQMFNSASANGPWTLMGLTTFNNNGHNGCGTLSSNFTFTVGPDHRFWATSRGGCVMDSDQVLGSYKVETDSVLPNLENGDNGSAEDQVIWYSGGYYHIVYNYWNVQRGYHIMSKDGKTNWTSTGLAYQGTQTPTNANSKWLRYTDGTVNTWHNMERAGVYEENGHVTHFNFAVTDTDKNSSAVNGGGSKILVVPFNGVQFDCDNGDAASCAEVAGGGGAGSGGAGGSPNGGSSGSGMAGAMSGGMAGASSGSGGVSADGGSAGTSGGTAGTTVVAVAGTAGLSVAGASPSGGATAQAGMGGATASQPGTGLTDPAPNPSGCSCRLGNDGSSRDLSAGLGLFVAAAVAARRRKRAA
ncbi:MAG: glycoside hydrolase family protein [Polyangiaceae bacterium]